MSFSRWALDAEHQYPEFMSRVLSLHAGGTVKHMVAQTDALVSCTFYVAAPSIGQGPVERIRAVHPTPTPASAAAAGAAPGDDSSVSPLASNTIMVRLAVLFVGGSFGVYELDALGKLRASQATPEACGKAGKVTDIGWLPVPR